MQINRSGIPVNISKNKPFKKDQLKQKHSSFTKNLKGKVYAEYFKEEEGLKVFIHDQFTFKKNKKNLKEGFTLISTWEV